MNEKEHVRSLVVRWYERKAWAESMLKERLEINAMSEIFRFGRAVEQEVPGTEWRYKTHGIGVSIHKPPNQSGGIDFDFDKPDPDAWRLREFAKRQVTEGALAQVVYERVFDDLNRLRQLLSEASEHRKGA